MIRGLRLADVLLQLVPGRLSLKDLAAARPRMVGRQPTLSRTQLAFWAAAPPVHECELVAVDNGQLTALAVVRRRSGPRSWEIAQLFAGAHYEAGLPGLLERAVGHVASQRGERLFLRVPQGTAVEHIAEGCGFRALIAEDVFSMERPMVTDLHPRMLELRPPLPADVYGIFRLYNAAYPADARAGIGVTLDQWQDSAERGVGRVREYLWVEGEALLAWVRFDQVGNVLLVDAMLHPDHTSDAPAFVAYVAQLAWGHRRPLWIVPGHQHAIARALTNRGWARRQRYTLMARMAATPVEEPGLAAARA